MLSSTVCAVCAVAADTMPHSNRHDIQADDHSRGQQDDGHGDADGRQRGLTQITPDDDAVRDGIHLVQQVAGQGRHESVHMGIPECTSVGMPVCACTWVYMRVHRVCICIHMSSLLWACMCMHAHVCIWGEHMSAYAYT